MKKFAMAAVAAAALSGGVAHAYTAGTFSNGFVVPNTINNGDTDATAIGLVNQSGAARAVYWIFFDQNSQHQLDGCFVMTDKESRSFVWSDSGTTGAAAFKGVRGYLVFAMGASAATAGTTALVNGQTTFTPTGPIRVPHQTCAGSALLAPEVPTYAPPVTTRDGAGNISVQRLATQLTGAAFQVQTATQDVQFLPVIPGNLVVNDFVVNGQANPNNNVVVAAAGLNGILANTVDIVKMGPDDLIGVQGAATTLTAAAPGFPQLPAATASNFSLSIPNVAQLNLLNQPAVAPTQMSLRYFIDANKAAGGNDTRLVFWSTGDQRGTFSVNAYDNKQNRISVNLNLLNTELDVVNPETAINLPNTFVDGFIEYEPFTAPNSNAPANVLVQGVNGAVAVNPALSFNGGSSYTFSTIISQQFGAVQTILGSHRNR